MAATWIHESRRTDHKPYDSQPAACSQPVNHLMVQDLQNWLNATLKQYAEARKTLVINVQLGVYDMNYLNTYQPNAALRAANNGRIAIFLIPADAATGQVVRALVAQPNGSGGSWNRLRSRRTSTLNYAYCLV